MHHKHLKYLCIIAGSIVIWIFKTYRKRENVVLDIVGCYGTEKFENLKEERVLISVGMHRKHIPLTLVFQKSFIKFLMELYKFEICRTENTKYCCCFLKRRSNLSSSVRVLCFLHQNNNGIFYILLHLLVEQYIPSA